MSSPADTGPSARADRAPLSTEQTPLLGAGAKDQPKTGLGRMSKLRITALAFSLWALIFLQGACAAEPPGSFGSKAKQDWQPPTCRA